MEKVFLATFHRGWNEIRVMCQMEKFHKRLLKLSKNVLRRLNKLQTIICIGTQKKTDQHFKSIELAGVSRKHKIIKKVPGNSALKQGFTRCQH